MLAAAITIGAGSLLSIFSEMESAKQQQGALNKQADALRNQAKEVVARSEINIKKLGSQSKGLQAESIALGAASGVDPLSGTGLTKIKAIAHDYAIAVNDSRREARFESEQLRAEADLRVGEGRAIKKAAPLKGLAQGLGGVGKVLSILS